MATDEKKNIMELPMQERVVAVALKHVFDQIKQLSEEEGKESHSIISSFTNKFKDLEDKVRIT